MDAQGISVIIPFRNSEQTIVRTLDSLHMQVFDGSVELILVDDRSTDQTVALVDAHDICSRWPVKHLQNPEGGLARAYNLGWQVSEFDVCLLCHSDCYPLEDNAFARIAEAMDEPDVVLGYPSIVLPDNAWDAMSFWDRVANARYVGKTSTSKGGKFTAVKSQALETLGGYDAETFFSAGEDVDMAMRLQTIGRFADVGVKVVHGHLYPPRSGILSLLRKQAQLGQGLGAVIRKYGRYPGGTLTPLSHVVKLLLIAGLFVPTWRWAALACLCVYAVVYSPKAFCALDWRVIIIIPVNIMQFVVFLWSALVGLVSGKQGYYYK